MVDSLSTQYDMSSLVGVQNHHILENISGQDGSFKTLFFLCGNRVPSWFFPTNNPVI